MLLATRRDQLDSSRNAAPAFAADGCCHFRALLLSRKGPVPVDAGLHRRYARDRQKTILNEACCRAANGSIACFIQRAGFVILCQPHDDLSDGEFDAMFLKEIADPDKDDETNTPLLAGPCHEFDPHDHGRMFHLNNALWFQRL